MTSTPGFVGARLTEARRARGISATDFADIVGISAVSISKYENGHQTPRLDVFFAMAAALNMPRAFFLRPSRELDQKPVFWRGRLSAPPILRERAAVLHGHTPRGGWSGARGGGRPPVCASVGLCLRW